VRTVLLAVADHTTIITGVLGAAATLAGLLVVFEGYLLSVYSSFPATADESSKQPYVIGVVAAAALITLSILISIGATLWLLGIDLFWLVAVGFLVLLVGIVAASVWVTKLVLG
jgi:hypothetical protein